MDAIGLYDAWARMMQNPQPVTLQSRQPGDTFLSWNLPGAGRGRASFSEPSGLKDQSLTWQVWQAMLDSAIPVAPATGTAPSPKVDDIIVDPQGVAWIITKISLELMGNVSKCECARTRGA